MTHLLASCVSIALVLFTAVSAAGVSVEQQDSIVDGATARIALRQDATVSRRDVTLGEVADIATRSLPLLRSLMALPLGQAGREPVQLEQTVVLAWIRSRLGVMPDRLVWTGASTSTVRLAMIKVAGEQIAQAAQEQLRNAFKANALRAEVNVLQVPRDVTVPGGKLKLAPRIALVMPSSMLNGGTARLEAAPPRRQTAWVDVWIDDHFDRTVPVGLEVQVFGPGYVMRRGLAAGEPVRFGGQDPDAFGEHEVNWSANATRPLQAAGTEGAGTLRLRHAVGTGQILTQADVEPAPSVARGNFATLHAQQGAVELETRVEVLQDAAIGQAVRVKLPNASTSIVARVTGIGQVEVKE